MHKNISLKIITGIALVILIATACSPVAMLQKLDWNQTQPRKTGVQLWAENCSRCHNPRAIDSYSDAEWDVAMLHMRIRANLAAEDARAITEYLKSAN